MDCKNWQCRDWIQDGSCGIRNTSCIHFRAHMVEPTVERERTVYGDVNKRECFFCGGPANMKFYTPPLYRSNESDDLRSYVVCLRCHARCVNFGHDHTHEELVEYIANLERRGSKKGRPSKWIKIPMDERSLEFVNRHILFEFSGRLVEPIDWRLDGEILVVIFGGDNGSVEEFLEQSK
jgi:hypothetical protein